MKVENDLRLHHRSRGGTGLQIGGLEFHDVVFLVVDDAQLTFGNFRIPGTIGFPVIEQMGEVHVHGSGLFRLERA